MAGGENPKLADYFRTVLSHNLSVFSKNLESRKYVIPTLERDWKFSNLSIFLMADVDGVFTYHSSLPATYFREILKKGRYSSCASKIEEGERKIDATGDGRYFEIISKSLFEAGLTWDDHLEACNIAGEETPITPHTHEALKSLYDIPPFVGVGWNSASWKESLVSFAKHKKLPISLIKSSWLEFGKNGKYTGRYFFNYGPNKFRSGKEMLSELGCVPDLRINKKAISTVTLSDTRDPDTYFRKFAGLGGMSLWMDKSIQTRLQDYLAKQEIVEINIPEIIEDMRIFAYLIKHFYRTKVITLLNEPKDLDVASNFVRQLIYLGKGCLKLADEKIFNEKIGEFIILTQNVLALLSKFDFPRYSTGLDFKYLDLLGEKDVRKKKEILSEIIETYIQNFPESLAEDGWLDGL